eukprot:468846-Amorphochlora_amoeboformis.AAC.2
MSENAAGTRLLAPKSSTSRHEFAVKLKNNRFRIPISPGLRNLPGVFVADSFPNIGFQPEVCG